MGIACPLALLFLIFMPFGVLVLHDVNRRLTRQFTIRGMMLFIFLWAVCLSQISVFREHRPEETIVWRQDWIVLFAWITLAMAYCWMRQFSVLLMHSTGVLFFICFSAIVYIAGNGVAWHEIVWRFGLGMIFGSFLGLILFSLMVLLTILRQPVSSPPYKGDNR